jgi:hypothetical protein
MAKARTNDRTRHDVSEEATWLLSRGSRAFEAPETHLIRREKPRREQHSVPPDREWPEMQQHGIDVPH